MAENVPITAGSGTQIATDEVTINSVLVQVQRVKTGWGADNAYNDTSAVAPLPVAVNDPDIVVGGTITVTDTAGGGSPGGVGALISITPTAGSFVTLASPGGDSAWNVQITGLTSGTLYFEESLDSTTGSDGSWVAVNGRQTGVVNTNLGNNATTNGVFRGNTSGSKYLRVRSVGTLTGTPLVTIRFSGGVGAVFLNASVPTGSNVIGAVSALQSSPAITSGTIINSTSTVTATNIGVYAAVTIGIYGTYAGVTGLFEASADNSIWFPLQGVRADSFVAETGPTTLANVTRAWDIPIQGFSYFRFRATAWSSGTANIVIIPTTAAVEPAPTVGVAAGTNSIGTILANGDTAAASTDAGNPIKIGGRAPTLTNSIPTAVTAGQRVNAWFDTLGRLVVVEGGNPLESTFGTTTLTTISSTLLITAPGAGINTYVRSMTVSNTSATGVRLDILDGATVKFSMFIAPSGGGYTWLPRRPLKLTANTALNGQLSAAVTDIRVNYEYYASA
jgi:hypothetical protein